MISSLTVYTSNSYKIHTLSNDYSAWVAVHMSLNMCTRTLGYMLVFVCVTAGVYTVCVCYMCILHLSILFRAKAEFALVLHFLLWNAYIFTKYNPVNDY